MRFRISRNILGLLLTLSMASALAVETFVVDDIRVEGLDRISAGAIFNKLPIAIGDTVDERRARDAIRALYKTGLFKDVRLDSDGDVLVVTIIERETIAALVFEGNSAIKTEDLEKGLKEAGFAEGEVFNDAKLDKVIQELKRQYFANGKYAVRLDTEVIPTGDEAVAIHFNIDEGPSAKIKQINIIGNKSFETEQLKELFKLNTTNMLSWFRKDDQYSKSKLSGDLETLRSLYLDTGFINFSIDSTQVSITPDKADVYITINVDEGERYLIGDVKLSGTLIVPPTELFRWVFTRKGMVFSRKALTATSKNVTDRLGNEGYAFANCNAIPQINEDTGTVDITYFVDPGQRTYVRRVNFFGNAKTRDEVMRREMRQLEGGWISTKKIERSKTRLRRLGYFEDVVVETPAVEGTPDQVDVNFSVIERPSGNLMLGFGFSQSAGFILNTNVNQNNFLGSGKSVNFAFNNSDIQKTFRLGYMDPFWTEDGVARGFDIMYSKSDAGRRRVSRYETESLSFGVKLGLPITEHNHIMTGLSYESTKINTAPNLLDPIIAAFMRKEGKSYNSIKFNTSYSYDTRNDGIFPDRGVLQRIQAIAALPGGDLTYWKMEWDGRIYSPLGKGYTGLLKGHVGYGEAYGGTSGLPFFENFYAGGPRTVRGFDEHSLGPQDLYGRALGGHTTVVFNAEVLIPMPKALAEFKSVRFSGFLDAGNVWSDSGYSFVEKTGDYVRGADGKPLAIGKTFSFSDMRASTGVSASWMSPFGMLAVSYAFPLRDKWYDEVQKFQFNFGAQY